MWRRGFELIFRGEAVLQLQLWARPIHGNYFVCCQYVTQGLLGKTYLVFYNISNHQCRHLLLEP